ncbi:MAG: DUF4956 domain-containing protein [Myxococcota bacterium]|nr:DUF4956 domain-containing protein [Myxococcota bacterium]
MSEILGLHPSMIDYQDFAKLGSRLFLDLFFTGIVVLWVYVRRYGRTEFVFTYFMFNVVTFTLCFLLRKVPIELGFALGLFAVFGILRYRTEAIRTPDLTYLFVVIGIAILNAVVNKKVSLGEVLLVNGAIVGLAAFLESVPALRHEKRQLVIYDNLELLRSGDKQALLADLNKRTGLDVKRVHVERFDLLRDTARLSIVYVERQERP